MSIFVLAGLLLSREDEFFHLEPHLRIHDVKPEVVVEYWIWRCLIKKSMPDTVSIRIWQNNEVCCGQNICVLLHFCFFSLCPNPNCNAVHPNILGTDYTGSCKSNYHTITTKTASCRINYGIVHAKFLYWKFRLKNHWVVISWDDAKSTYDI